MQKLVYKYGIDYGTTNSSIALSIYQDDEIITTLARLEDAQPTDIMPSRVLVAANSQLYVGRSKVNVPVNEVKRILRAVKMDLEPHSEEDGNPALFVAPTYKMGRKTILVADVIAAVLKRMREQAEAQFKALDVKVSGVVMGVPVNFGDAQKKILMEALTKAGFYKTYEDAEEKTEFVSEPLAVAIEYGEKTISDKNVFVFDFGGGTLDFAVMNLKRNVGMNDHLHPHDVICKDRATIGGEKLTKAFFINSFCSIKKYGVAGICKAFGIKESLSAGQLWDKLQSGECGTNGWAFVEKVDNLKCTLSYKPAADFNFLGEYGVMLPRMKFLREDFESAISTPIPGEEYSAFSLVKNAVNDFISSNNIDVASDIDVVLTAGGSSLIPCVQNFLYEIFPIPEQLHQDAGRIEKLTSIVRGLSIVGCRKIDILDDVVDCDFGFYDTKRKCFQPVIERGTKIADTMFNRFTRQGKKISIRMADQSAYTLAIDIIQRSKASGEYKLGTIEITNADPHTYDIFMTVSKGQGTLTVYLYDKDKKVWLDHDGKISETECKYELKQK